MSRPARLVMKFTLLLAPAVLASVLLGIGGSQIRSFARSIFAPSGHRIAKVGDHTFTVPQREWADELGKFVEDYNVRFAADQPFRNSDVAEGGVKKVNDPPRQLRRPLEIIVTPDRDAFARQAFGESGGALPFSGGYFNPLKSSITIHATSIEQARETLSHELAHAIMHYSYPDPQWSPWFSEGIAQWGETTRADQTLGTANVRKLKSARDSLSPGKLKGLLGAAQDRFLGHDNLWYYQSSYALVCFLLAERRDAFLAYFNEETAAGPLDSAARFASIVGPIDQIERRWFEWLREQK